MIRYNYHFRHIVNMTHSHYYEQSIIFAHFTTHIRQCYFTTKKDVHLGFRSFPLLANDGQKLIFATEVQYILGSVMCEGNTKSFFFISGRKFRLGFCPGKFPITEFQKFRYFRTFVFILDAYTSHKYFLQSKLHRIVSKI